MKDLIIRRLQPGEDPPYDLLLLADPSKELIDEYINNSTVYVAIRNGTTIGCYVLMTLDIDVVEIKNIAVHNEHQGVGIGTELLNHAIAEAKMMSMKKILIGTGNSSLSQLHLYQKLGFRITGVKRDFFTTFYKETIFENGLQCIDMIVLTKEL